MGLFVAVPYTSPIFSGKVSEMTNNCYEMGPEMSEITKNTDVDVEDKRRLARRHVLLKALLDTGHYEFECMAYDLSLKGAKLKLDLPLETKCEVHVLVKDSPLIPAKVVWAKEGFIGLEFGMTVKQVQVILDGLGVRLPDGQGR